ncbi:mucin-2 protein [Nocardioides sp. URHA0020]|uniref:mucin-2 protein n=1 Tax=Nocardioides sp. URHA0020 TaxID=1380392 RepID=UPI000AF84606|nr:mucin-2 protein [Nocardioides sp. URHA0020]
MAEHRHKRDTDARRKPRAATVAAPLALLATASAVTIGVLASSPDPGSLLATRDATTISRATPAVDGSSDVASRAESRLGSRVERAQLQRAFDRSQRRAVTRAAVRAADTRMWTTADLNLWLGAAKDAAQDGEIKTGKRILVTGRKSDGRVEVAIDGQSRWITAGYLSDEKPPTAPAGLSMAPCPDPGVENGLTKNAVYVYRSVCHAFPQITSYGGWDGHGEHSSGKALDIMTSDVTLGTAIADFLRSHAAELQLYDILWRQRIFTQQRGGEGWRTFPDRGSATANHFDHVHVSTY